MISKIKIGSLFAGVGGIELGFLSQKTCEVSWAVENDKYAQTTYKENFKHNLIEDNIEKVKGKSLNYVDILTAGFPCQAFSIAGYQKGFTDSRGNLFFEIIRIINELSKRPKVLFLENVKNLRTHDNKKTYRIIHQCLESLGYCVFTETLNTSTYTEIPQNSERTFIICFDEGNHAFLNKNKKMSYFFNQHFPPKKVSITKNFREFLSNKKENDKYYYRENNYNYKDINAALTEKYQIGQWRRVYLRINKSNLCPTLTANMGTGGHNVPLIRDNFGIRKLTPRECFNLQGFDQSFKLPKNVSDNQLYKQAGNSVTVPIVKRLTEIIFKCFE